GTARGATFVRALQVGRAGGIGTVARLDRVAYSGGRATDGAGRVARGGAGGVLAEGVGAGLGGVGARTPARSAPQRGVTALRARGTGHALGRVGIAVAMIARGARIAVVAGGIGGLALAAVRVAEGNLRAIDVVVHPGVDPELGAGDAVDG